MKRTYFKRLTFDQIKIPEVRVSAVFDPEIWEEFKLSIKETGVQNPILCIFNGKDYSLVDGLHRLLEAKRSGQRDVLCVVRRGDVKDVLMQNLISARLRGRSDPIAEVRVIKALNEEYKVPWNQIERMTGLKKETIQARYDLLFLDDRVQKLVTEGKLKVTHALQLVRLDDKEEQYKLALDIIDFNYTAEQVKESIRGILAYPPKEAKVTPEGFEPVKVEPLKTTCRFCHNEIHDISHGYIWLCPECMHLVFDFMREYTAKAKAESEKPAEPKAE